MALFSTTPEGLNNLVQAVNKHSAAYKLSINAAKTKIMELDKWQENTNIVIDNITLNEFRVFNIWAQCLPQMETVLPA